MQRHSQGDRNMTITNLGYRELKNKKPTRCHLLFYCTVIGSTCFGHCYAHHQELMTMMLITTLVVSFLACYMLEVRCGWAGVVSGLQAKARTLYIYIYTHTYICSNGRNEMRKLCTINNSAKNRPIDVNIIPD